MIRPVRYDDFDPLLAILKSIPALQNTVFAEYDESILYRSFGKAIQNGFARIVERDGKIYGASFCVISRNQWGSLCAHDLMTYSTRETPALIREYVEWARSYGVKDKNIFIANSYGTERYSKLIRKLGFTQDTIMFRKGE